MRLVGHPVLQQVSCARHHSTSQLNSALQRVPCTCGTLTEGTAGLPCPQAALGTRQQAQVERIQQVPGSLGQGQCTAASCC